MRGWFRRYLCWLLLSRKSDEEKNSGDDHSAWWAAQMATYADFVGDSLALAEVWKLVESGKAHLDLDPQARTLVGRIGRNTASRSSIPPPLLPFLGPHGIESCKRLQRLHVRRPAP